MDGAAPSQANGADRVRLQDQLKGVGKALFAQQGLGVAIMVFDARIEPGDDEFALDGPGQSLQR